MKSIESSESKQLSTFFLLVFIFTLPAYVLMGLASNNIFFSPEMTMSFIPLSSLAPIGAGLVLRFRESGGRGIKELLWRSFDYKRISNKAWYIPALLLMPFLLIVSLGIMELMGFTAPASQFPVAAIPVLFVVFFLTALGEQLGWMGYAFEKMENQSNTFRATLTLGLIWAVWHIPMYGFMLQDSIFFAALLLLVVALRFLLVWIFNHTGKSLLAVILCHASYNLATVALPTFGVQPPLGVVITSLIVLFAALLVVGFRGLNSQIKQT